MITYIKGKLIEKKPTYIIIECNGIGYFIHISLHTYSLIPDKENLSIHTYYQVREDAHLLYGFYEEYERAVFKLLISVSGVGTNTARTMLSSLTPQQVVGAISNKDNALIQSAKGIGVKTAQRIILDLEDKVLKIASEEVETGTPSTQKTSVNTHLASSEALSALEVLGYPRKTTTKVVASIVKKLPESSVEQIIKQALKKL